MSGRNSVKYKGETSNGTNDIGRDKQESVLHVVFTDFKNVYKEYRNQKTYCEDKHDPIYVLMSFVLLYEV
jgi:hypothetical protein